MRTRTRNFLLGILAVLVLLIGLGAVPGLLKSGDPYYLTATPTGEWTGENTSVEGNTTAINASSLTELRHPYSTGALGAASADSAGQSKPYWRGPVGIKETFTHSPFDEMSSFEQRYPTAVGNDGVYVHTNRTVYLLTVTQEDV
jgi:hypothetical protein